MNTGVYGSPFPKLNPNVRYRTVFERAGFDTNKPQQALPQQSAQQQFPPHQSPYEAVAPSNSMAQLTERTAAPPEIPVQGRKFSSGGSSGMSDSFLFEKEKSEAGTIANSQYSDPRPAPSPFKEQQRQAPPQAPYSDPRQAPVREPFSEPRAAPSPYSQSISSPEPYSEPRTAPAPALYSQLQRQQQHPNQNMMHAEPVQQVQRMDTKELNPVDKSFMMLIQNDTKSISSYHSSSNNSNSNYSNSNNKKYSITMPSPVEELRIPSPVKINNTLNKDTDILKFRPDEDLITPFANNFASKPNNISHASSQPSISIKPDPDLQVETGTETNTSKNAQVEQLIAELDDVSFSRNEKITATLGSNNASNALSTDVTALLSVGGTGQTSNSTFEDLKYKKSSAYLSGFPGADKTLNQKVFYYNHLDHTTLDILPNSPLTEEGTPTFVKFKSPNAFEDGKESPSSITKLQMADEPQKEPEPEIKYEPIPVVKYPRGIGPCRICGKEITDKSVFSKKDNELSGQWHRKCFKCTRFECPIIFNKKTPCYILEDKPFCQQHYHEENHSICQVCSKFIEGECLENDNLERFHVNCLKCFVCKKSIENDYYIFNDEVPICGDHDMDVLLQDGLSTFDGDDLNHSNTVSKRRTRMISFFG